MKRRGVLATASVCLAGSISGCQAVLSRRKYSEDTPLNELVLSAAELSEYRLSDERARGPTASSYRLLGRAFEPNADATPPVAAELTSTAVVYRSANEAKEHAPGPVKDALEGHPSVATKVSIGDYQAWRYRDYPGEGVYTILDGNLGVGLTGRFEAGLTKTRWNYLRQHIESVARRVVEL